MVAAGKSDASNAVTILGITPSSLHLLNCCSTCGLLLDEVPRWAEGEKKYPSDRSLDCCGRNICGCCLYNNQRLAFYCPYCQTNFPSSSLSSAALGTTARPDSEPIGLLPLSTEEPTAATTPLLHTYFPSLTFSPSQQPCALSSTPSLLNPRLSSTPNPDGKGCIHYLSPSDTLNSISLLYSVPPLLVRRANRLAPSGADDNLVMAMRTLLIPTTTVSKSSSPNLHLSEEQAQKQLALRRFMNCTKETDYQIAATYLDECEWDADTAAEKWESDEAWVHENGGYSGNKMKEMKGWIRTERELLGCGRKEGWWGAGEPALFLRLRILFEGLQKLRA